MRNALFAFTGLTLLATSAGAGQQVVFDTTLGQVVIELDEKKAPVTSQNFLAYVDAGFYDGVIFHRVIEGFMLQGGGFTSDLQKKPVRKPIQNEAANGLKNLRGTLSMARTNDPNSATSQFFINLVDNAFLDHRGPAQMGYAVFAKVVSGMEVVDAIGNVKTLCPSKPRGPCTDPLPPGMRDVPATPVVIKKAARK